MLAVGDGVLSFSFVVHLGEGLHDLGAWQEVELGGAELTIQAVEEGGNLGFVHQLPGGLRWQPIRLSRLVNDDTPRVARWFTSLAQSPERSTGVIQVTTRKGDPVVEWSFVGALPTRWTLPSMTVEASRPAIERLELVHEGFQF